MDSEQIEFVRVLKRNGNKDIFDLTKIKDAIIKAMKACKINDNVEEKAREVSKKVYEKIDGPEIIDIENIQDNVEDTLMDFGFHDVAKAYILYRFEHMQIREANHVDSTKTLNHSIHIDENLKALADASSKQFDYDVMRELVFIRTYARWKKNEKRREFWQETVERLVEFVRSKIGDKLSEKDYHDIFDYVFQQKVMPSMRLLQFAGPAAERCNVCIYNCAFSAPESFKDLADIMYLSMSGTGVGFSVEKENVDRFPQISLESYPEEVVHHTVKDSKEGWCDSLQLVLKESFAGRNVAFNYRELRPKGARLVTSGGRSSGPEPLKDLHRFIKDMINQKRREKIRKLSPLNVHDIICKIGQIVIAGGTRRCIAKGSKVITESGSYKNIEDIKIGDRVLSGDGNWSDVTNTMEQGIQKVIRIHHQEGTIDVTPNHRVATYPIKDCEPVWKNAEDLSTDDTLGFPQVNKIGTWEKASFPNFVYVKPPHSSTCKNIIIPKLDVNMAWFIGNFQGDGCVHLTSKSGQLSVAVYGEDEDMKDLVVEQFERFGVNVRIQQPSKKDNCYKICVKSKQLAVFFHEHVKQSKTSMKVPDFIKNASPKIKGAFVQGLMDADGSVKTRPVNVVTTIYKDYAYEIQAILLSMTIMTRIKINYVNKEKNPKWQDKYQVNLINPYDKRNFQYITSNVGFKRFEISKPQYNNGWKLSQITSDESFEKPTGWYKKVNQSNADGNIPIDTLRQFDIKTDIIPIKIKSIEKLDEEVETYDIEVENSHNFVCNSILVHNSALLGLSDLSDHEIRDCKSGQFWINNPQRSLANNSTAYNCQPSQIEFMSEWIAIAKSGTGEPGIWNRSGLREVMHQRRVEYLGDKIDKMGCNPCVTIDTKIMCPNGYQKVADLIGGKQLLLINGKKYETTEHGFWKSGHELVYELITESCRLKCTAAHSLIKFDPKRNFATFWMELKDLKPGDLIGVANHHGHMAKYEKIISINPLNEQDVYDCTIDSNEIHEYDSNGIRSHNCAEVILQSFQFCNLTEVVCRSDDTEEDLAQKIRVAAIIGTIQSSFSDYKYIESKWKDNQDAERLLGVSLTGVYDCPILRKENDGDATLRMLRDLSIEVNSIYAEKLGINASHAVTVNKPSGSVSQMVNSSSGIHPRYSKYYIRRIRIAAHDPLLELMRSEGYDCKPENNQVEPNVNTYVLSFPVASPEGAITTNDVSTIEQLENWKRFKLNYTEHNPSVTIHVKSDEWLETGKWVWDNWKYVTGIAFLPYSDHIYEQAPYEEITKEQYEEMKSNLKHVDFTRLMEFEKEDNTDVKKELACVGGACEL
tara:strand:- start:33396 stop:37352 length:3957 start_codon:yes stop_codon:yes gene_type:complete